MSVKAKLLCPQCGILVRIMEYTASDDAVLACGHTRTRALLPTNGVSTETMGTRQGIKLFPVQWDEVRG